ncbi:hypothetical protein HDU98_009888 [Podochytrium sp. JEL0797]|nr:hypothetical protein HDU98_009888 [Podochytrium sp. JEL0797]
MTPERVIVALPTLLAAFRLYTYDHSGLCLALACISFVALLPHTARKLSPYRLENLNEQGVSVSLVIVPLVLASCLVQLERSQASNESIPYVTLMLCMSLCSAVGKVAMGVQDVKGSWVVVVLLAGVVGGSELELAAVRGLSLYAIVPMLATPLVATLLTVLSLLKVLKSCFTLGEAMIMSDLIVLFVLDTAFGTIGKVFPTYIPAILTIERDPIHFLSQGLILGMILIGFATMPILSRIQTRQKSLGSEKPRKREETNLDRAVGAAEVVKLSMLFYAAILGMIVCVIRPWTLLVLPGHRDPFLWLVGFVIEQPVGRIGLLVYWVLVVGVGVLLAVVQFGGVDSAVGGGGGEVKSKKGLTYLNFKRKYFHVLAIVMFVPGYLVDNKIMRLSFSVALSALILIEYIRVFTVWPFGHNISVFLRNFLDNKDRGVFILSHFYLLLGCALTVYIDAMVEDGGRAGLYGVVALGVADACASVVGYRYGKVKWGGGGGKTVEGTVAFVGSMFGACVLLGVGSGLLEASSVQNDNLLLPLISISVDYLL